MTDSETQSEQSDTPKSRPQDGSGLSTFEMQTSDKVTVYTSQSEVRDPIGMFKNIFSDFWSGRELGWRLFLRNLKGLYRQTLLGLFWVFLPPIANTAVWVFLRGQNVFSFDEMEVEGTIYILTGMILWQAFVEAFQMPLKVINQNRGMISKLRFPRESLLLVGFCEILFDLSVRSLLLVPAFFAYEVQPHWTILLAIPLAILMIMFASALGMLLMPIGSLYQDVSRFIILAIPAWMIITPIIHVAKDDLRGQLLVWLNPAAPLLVLSRDLILLGDSSFIVPGLVFAAITIPLFFLGLAVFRISIPVIVERMTAY